MTGSTSQKNSKKLQVLVYVILVILGGLLVMLADLQAEKTKFLKYSDLVYKEVHQRLVTTEAVINSLVLFGHHNEAGNGGYQEQMIDGLIRTYPYIDAVARLDWVRNRDRLDYEKGLRSFGQGASGIREYDQQAKAFTRARKRTSYLVTNDILPSKFGSAQLDGLNLLTDPELEKAIEFTMQNQVASLIRPPDLIPIESGMAMVKNTYTGLLMPASVNESKSTINGTIILFINTAKLIDLVAANFPEIMLKLEIDDFKLTDPNKKDIYPEHGYAQDLQLTSVSFVDARAFNLANRNLSLRVSSLYQPGPAQIVIAAVIMLLIAAALRFWKSSRDNQRIVAEKQEEAFQELYSERERAEVTLSSIGDAVITTDEQQRVTFMNPVAEAMMGMSNELAFEKPLKQIVRLLDENSGELVEDPISYCAEQSHDHSEILVHLLDQGEEREPLSVDISCSTLKSMEGVDKGMVIVIRDTSRERELKKQLTYQASHDPLTGLVNRIKFEEEVKQAIRDTEDGDIGHTLCYMDLDQFKIVNDTCGHIAGDSLLKQLSQLLSKRVRDSDVLARLGGDEFGLLLRNCDLEDAVPIADTLRMAVRQFIFRWDEHSFDIRISIGVVAITDPKSTHAELMSAADVACYIAKESGRDYVHAYQPEDESVTKHHELMQWSQRIHDALRTDKFYLMLQSMTPLLSAQSNIQIQEFLLRIRMDDGTIVTPDTFIPAAERYGLMRDIDMWVIDHTLQIIRDVAKDTEPSVTYIYSINLSGQSVGDAEVSECIIRKIKEYEIDPAQLMLEITETAAITNFQTAMDFINQLSEIGCRFALDDFGAGLSSFGYLKRMKVDFIKIDGQFVKGMADDPIDRMMVNNITHLAYGLGLFVIAESVEDEVLMEMLRDIGVHFAQGYHIQHPTSIEDWKQENMLKTIFMRTVH